MSYEDPLKEAADPATDPERLRELADHKDKAVRRAVWRNPSLPEDVWRNVFLEGGPEAWANPMTPLYVLTWTPRQDDEFTLEAGARWATDMLWREPTRCSPEGKALLATKVQAWWATSENVRDMMMFLGWWCRYDGTRSAKHLEVLRILILCVRTAPDLTDEDRDALDLLKSWCAGGEDRCKEAEDLASSDAVKDTVSFALDCEHSPWNAIYEMLWAVDGNGGASAKAEHERLLADVIRHARPLPPVVE
jgi:hypothetical protein